MVQGKDSNLPYNALKFNINIFREIIITNKNTNTFDGLR